MYLTRATHKAIKIACTYFHYSRSVPSVSYGYNVFSGGGEWCGVICFGVGANKRIGGPFGLTQKECVELVRVALNGKQEHTSQAVALSLKQLHKDNPEIKLVVSYADAGQNHLGIIYQATNWIYIEHLKAYGYEFLVNGEWVHNRSVCSLNNKRLYKTIRDNAPKRRCSDKFKYIYVFDKKLRKEWQKKSLPYPKKLEVNKNERKNIRKENNSGYEGSRNL